MLLTTNRLNNQDIDLLDILFELLRNKRKIAIITVISIALFAGYVFISPPVYRANMLIQVDDTPSQNLLDRLTDNVMGTASGSRSATEVGLLKSRLVLGEVSEAQGLLNQVKPAGFLARFSNRLSANTLPGVVVATLKVPDELINTPLALRVLSPKRYELSLPNGATLTGNVNETLKNQGVEINISRIHGAPGSVFNVTRLYELDVVDNLLGRLSISDVGKDSGLLAVQLTGGNKQQITTILNAIGDSYLNQGLLRKAEETTRRLQFVDELMPGVDQKLNEAIANLRDFQQQNESVDMSLEAKAALDTTTSLQAQLNELQFQKAEISKLYTADHPASRSLAEKESVLKKQLSKINSSITSMPRKQQEILKLTRDVQTNQEIYTQLLTRQQELRIMKASTVNNARVVDKAVAEMRPIAPRKVLMYIIGALFGLVVSCGWVLLNRLLRSNITSPAVIEDAGLEVLAMVPVSKWLSQQNSKIPRRAQMRSRVLLAKERPEDMTVEAIRNLRTSMTLIQGHKLDSVIAVSSATAGVGKSFVACNLAAVLAQAGKRVLLIDADLRCGSQHHLLGMSQRPGLSDLLKGNITFEQALQEGATEGLTFVPCGDFVERSSELLMTDAMARLIGRANTQFDYVIIDTPPVLPITDAALIGKHVGRLLMVTGYNKESQQEFALAVKRFERNSIPIYGVVLNGIEPDVRSGYGYGTFQYTQSANKAL